MGPVRDPARWPRGNCPVLAGRKDLTQSCPGELQLRSPAGSVLASTSGCEAFRTDELCCRNIYNSPRTCRASKDSEFFKRECPQAFTTRTTTPLSPTSAPRRARSRSSSATSFAVCCLGFAVCVSRASHSISSFIRVWFGVVFSLGRGHYLCWTCVLIRV
jgi:hypothetical protein